MIIKKILQNLINTREVESFINNIIIETEEKEEKDKVIKEIVRRLMENHLYVKLKKYKWKVRKVEFLGVVIELERIKKK